jgi:hypothetical protein
MTAVTVRIVRKQRRSRSLGAGLLQGVFLHVKGRAYWVQIAGIFFFTGVRGWKIETNNKYSFFIPVEFRAWYVDKVRHGDSTGKEGFLFVFSPNDTKLCSGDRIFGEKKVFFKRLFYFWRNQKRFLGTLESPFFWFWMVVSMNTIVWWLISKDFGKSRL